MSNFNLLSCLEVVDLWLETIVAEVILYVAEVILDVAEVILSFHEINGFLSLQLGLSFELGFRLRLTNRKSATCTPEHDQSAGKMLELQSNKTSQRR